MTKKILTLLLLFILTLPGTAIAWNGQSSYSPLAIFGTTMRPKGSTWELSLRDNNIFSVGDIALDSVSSASSTTLLFTLGTDVGDDFIVGSNLFYIRGDNGKVGIGTDLSVAAGTVDLFVVGSSGSIRLASNLTDNMTKVGRLTVAHYSNSEQAVTGMNLNAAQFTSAVNYGGGSAAENAVTALNFYTAANNTTTTGTRRMRINNLGLIGVGPIIPNQVAMLHIQPNLTTEQGLIVQGVVSQSADLMQAMDSSGNIGLSLKFDFDLVLGSGAVGKDYTLTFNGEDTDGLLRWLEDEDSFLFLDDVLMSAAMRLYFRDSGLSIHSSADGELDLSTDGNITFGDGGITNYTNIDSVGSMTMVGTARVERFVESMNITGRGASAPTERTAEAPYLSWTFNVGNDSHQSFEVPYMMDYTSTVNVKVHWYTSVSQTNDEVRFQAMWNAIPEAGGEVINGGATTITSADTLCPTQWHITETSIGTIAGGSISQDDMMGLDFERIAIVDGTAPAINTIHVLSIEFEYCMNKLGEAL